MESWLENFRPASFRGIPFFILTSSLSAGRRVALHEFPNRNTSFPEDMGKVSTVYRIEGHVVGDDYFERKEALVRAMEQEGFGELIHPYYGTLQVQPGSFTVEENTNDGRTATFTMQFFKAEFNEFPIEDIDLKHLHYFQELRPGYRELLFKILIQYFLFQEFQLIW